MSVFGDSALNVANGRLSFGNASASGLFTVYQQLSQKLLEVNNIRKKIQLIEEQKPEDLSFTATDLISRVSAQLDKVVADSAVLRDAMNANAEDVLKQFRDVAERLAQAEDAPDQTPLRQVSGASTAHDAVVRQFDLTRKDAEVGIFATASQAGFIAPPGMTLGAVMKLREEYAQKIGESANTLMLAEMKANAQLYAEWVQNNYQNAARAAELWASYTSRLMGYVAEIIVAYMKSPLLDAERQMIEIAGLLDGFGTMQTALTRSTAALTGSYDYQLAQLDLETRNDELRIMEWVGNEQLKQPQRRAIISDMAQLVQMCGQASSAINSAVTAHGHYTERGFQ